MIDLFYPYVPPEAAEEVTKVLAGRWIGQGPQVKRFEEMFGFLFDVKYPVSVNSGTSALDIAYELIGIKEGDEVITTPLTCTATNIPLLRRKAKIVWADIDPNTLCISPKDAARKITEKTKAVVQVHLGGISAQCAGAMYNGAKVPVVSDACQALGIFRGDYTCCSFQAIKHITTGDGGMLVVRNEADYRNAKLLRWFGIDRERKEQEGWQAYKERKMTFDIELPGFKAQMTDIAATLGMAGLQNYYRVINYRQDLFRMYQKEFDGMDGITMVDGTKNTYWLATVLVDRRNDFARMLYDADVDTNIVQVRNDVYSIFGGKRADLPVMNALEEKYISLPLGMHVTPDDVAYICSKIHGGW